MNKEMNEGMNEGRKETFEGRHNSAFVNLHVYKGLEYSRLLSTFNGSLGYERKKRRKFPGAYIKMAERFDRFYEFY